MKKSLCLSILFLTPWAWAENITENLELTSLQAPLTHIQLDDRQFAQNVEKAYVQIDMPNQEIHIILRQQNHCQTATDNDAPCVMMRPSDRTISLPLISQERDACGIITWVADRDSRAQDGPRETIVILDHSKMVCRIYVPRDEITQVRYTYLMEGRKIQGLYESIFAGSALEAILL